MGTIRGLDCSLAYGENDQRRWVWCGDALKARQTVWCSPACGVAFAVNHYWTNARAAAVERDGYTCVRCVGVPILRNPDRREFGWDERTYEHALGEFKAEVKRRKLEVNHKVALVGRGYGYGCVHHQSNLETLCHDHHVGETTVQVRTRRGRPVEMQLGLAV